MGWSQGKPLLQCGGQRLWEAVGGLWALQVDTTVVTQAVFSDKYFALCESLILSLRPA